MKPNDILREWAEILAIRAVAADYAIKARRREKKLREKVGAGNKQIFQLYIQQIICQQK